MDVSGDNKWKNTNLDHTITPQSFYKIKEMWKFYSISMCNGYLIWVKYEEFIVHVLIKAISV